MHPLGCGLNQGQGQGIGVKLQDGKSCLRNTMKGYRDAGDMPVDFQQGDWISSPRVCKMCTVATRLSREALRVSLSCRHRAT